MDSSAWDPGDGVKTELEREGRVDGWIGARADRDYASDQDPSLIACLRPEGVFADFGLTVVTYV